MRETEARAAYPETVLELDSTDLDGLEECRYRPPIGLWIDGGPCRGMLERSEVRGAGSWRDREELHMSCGQPWTWGEDEVTGRGYSTRIVAEVSLYALLGARGATKLHS